MQSTKETGGFFSFFSFFTKSKYLNFQSAQSLSINMFYDSLGEIIEEICCSDYLIFLFIS